jgi:hypothetical protein
VATGVVVERVIATKFKHMGVCFLFGSLSLHFHH